MSEKPEFPRDCDRGHSHLDTAVSKDGKCLYDVKSLEEVLAQTDPKPPTVEELVREAHLLTQRIPMRKIINALAARVRELEQQRDDGDLAFNHANECIGKLEADLETMKRQRDEARAAVVGRCASHPDGREHGVPGFCGGCLGDALKERDEARGEIERHHDVAKRNGWYCEACAATLREGREWKG